MEDETKGFEKLSSAKSEMLKGAQHDRWESMMNSRQSEDENYCKKKQTVLKKFTKVQEIQGQTRDDRGRGNMVCRWLL